MTVLIFGFIAIDLQIGQNGLDVWWKVREVRDKIQSLEHKVEMRIYFLIMQHDLRKYGDKNQRGNAEWKLVSSYLIHFFSKVNLDWI